MAIKCNLILIGCCCCSILFGETLGATTSEVVKVISEGRFVHGMLDGKEKQGKTRQFTADAVNVIENLLCFGMIEGRTIKFRYANKSPLPLAIRRTTDFRYWLTYKDASDAVHQVNHNEKGQTDAMQVEILAGTKDVRPYGSFSELRLVPLPQNCARVDRLEVELESVSFYGLATCTSMYEIEKLFATNAFRKVINFDFQEK